MAKESLYGIERRLVFRETFESEESVRRNGGVPTNVTFEKGKANFISSSDSQILIQSLVLKEFSVRFKGSITTGGAILGNKFSVNNYEYLSVGNSAIALSTYVNHTATVAVSLISNVVYDIVWTIKSGEQKIYVNGISQTVTNGARIFPDFKLRMIGNYGNGGGDFNGSMELLEIYSGTLTAQEVKNLYENKRHRELVLNKGEQLGPELVDQSAWFTRAYWVAQSDPNWSQVGNTLSSNGSNGYLTKANFWSTSKVYRITYTCTRTAGTLYTAYGVTLPTGSVLSETVTRLYQPDSTNINIRSAAFNGTITALSVKEFLVPYTKEILNVSADSGVVRNRLSGDTINGVTVPSVIPTAISLVKQGEVNLMKFNGNSKIDVGSYDPMTGDRTFVAWISDNNSVDFARIISNSKFDVYKFGADLYIRSDGSGTARCNGILNGAGGVTNLFMFCFTRTSTGVVRVYKNGVAQTMVATTSGIPVAGTTNLAIGTLSSSLYWKGTMDGVRIIDGILTPEEISQLYTNEKDKYGL